MEQISIAKPKLFYEELQNVKDVIKSGCLAQGENVKKLEEQFAKYIGTKYAIAVGNGTEALHCAYLALDIKPGDEVITTPFTFIATINMIKACGATPVFVDIKDDFNMNVDEIESVITEKTKAIVPVHLYGNPCDMDKILKLAKKYNLKVVEDTCQSLGADYKDKKAGSMGDIGCFSFYATKNITTGEGGMCVTNDAALARKIRLLRSHGMNEKGEFECMGYNYRMTDIQAAIGLAQLSKLDSFLRTRRDIAKSYSFHFSDYIKCPESTKDKNHAFNNYTFCTKNRDLFLLNLKENGIDARVYYPVSHADLPNVNRIIKEVVSLPIRPNLTTDEIKHITSVVSENLERWYRE